MQFSASRCSTLHFFHFTRFFPMPFSFGRALRLFVSFCCSADICKWPSMWFLPFLLLFNRFGMDIS